MVVRFFASSLSGLWRSESPRELRRLHRGQAQSVRSQGLEALVAPPEGFAVGKHAAYLHCASGILESKAAEALLGKAGRAATTRNWATTLKIHAIVGDA